MKKKKLLPEPPMGTNGIISDALECVDGVYIRLIKINGFVRVIIELAGDTTGDELKAIIPDALRWRDALNEKQVPLWGGEKTLHLAELENAFKAGVTYREIAMKINQGLAKLLVEAGKNKYRLVFVYSNLDSMGFDRDEIENIIDAGLQNIKNDLPAFDNVEYPIDRNRVIRVLAWWRKKIKNIEPPNRIGRLGSPGEYVDI